MKALIIAILGLPLVLFGVYQVQGEEMGKMDDGMSMSQTMHSGDNMKPADSGDMMKADGMKKNDHMMKDQNMHQKQTYTVPSDAVLRERLTPLQYKVTRKEGTEPAFNNAYWNNHEPGIYVDIISGEPLFSSKDKYESGTGWPSFTKPINPDSVVVKEDRSFFMVRNEVRSKISDAHLGHVFDDGPQPTGLRYCMNSASLRFIPAADLEKEGYGEYADLFK